MKKLRVLFILLIIISLTAFSKAELEVEKVGKATVIISELKNPAIFDFIINNNGEKENIEIYSLVSVSMTPKGRFSIEPGRNKVEVMAFPGEGIRNKNGFFNFEYQIKGSESGIFKDNLMIKIVPLKEVITIEPLPLHPLNSEAEIIVRNIENINLEDVIITLDSQFFSGSQKVSLRPYEKLPVKFKVNKEVNKLTAGKYIVTASIKIEDKETNTEGVLEYLESEGTSYDISTIGTIVRTTTMKKTNYGNIPASVNLEIEKDIISRLFTSYSTDPLTKDRNGFLVKYAWQKNLVPSESFEVNVKTNYTIPFILIILIVVVGLFAKIYSQTAITLNKRVSYVNTRGKQFALKVNLHVKARKHVDNVQIIDRLPNMTKLYEKFGKTPDKIDNATKRIFWNLDKLSKGEERVYTYIIYSELKVIGRFELPAATAIFEKDGKTSEAWSNKTFFAAETSKDK